MNTVKRKYKKKRLKVLIEDTHLGSTGVVLVKIQNQLHQQVNLIHKLFLNCILKLKLLKIICF